MIFDDINALLRFGTSDAAIRRMYVYQACDQNDAAVMTTFESPMMQGFPPSCRVTPAERVRSHEASIAAWLRELLDE